MTNNKRTANRAAAVPDTRESWRRTVLVCAALALLTAAAYGAARNFDFVNWDDPTYILENANVLRGLSTSNAMWALVTQHAPYWHPLTWMSHMLDVTFFGVNPGAHHITSIVIHAVNCMLLFTWLSRATKAVWLSAFTAAVFAVHPLHVESVVWIAERKDVLCAFFTLLTLIAYTRYTERPSMARYLVVAAGLTASLMAKPMAVTTPALLLLVDVWPLQRLSWDRSALDTWKRAVLEKLPLLAIAGAVAVMTVLVQRNVGALSELQSLPWTMRAAMAVSGYLAYVQTTFWPAGLAPFYPIQAANGARVIAGALLLLTATLTAFHFRRSKPYLFAGWTWFIVLILPVSGLVQSGGQARADRFAYLALLGLVVAAVWTIRDLAAQQRLVQRSLPVASALIIGALVVTAHAQTQVWANSLTLWQYSADAAPSYLAYENLGQAQREANQLDAAERSYMRALQLADARATEYQAVIENSLGLIAQRKGALGAARTRFETAVRLNQDFSEARTNFANALASTGQLAQAEQEFAELIRQNASAIEPRIGLAGTQLSSGQLPAAEASYRKAIVVDGASAEAHAGLGAVLTRQKRYSEATTELEEAIALNPQLANAELNLGIALAEQNQLEAAIRSLQRALQIDPSLSAARQALALLAPPKGFSGLR